MYKLIEAEMAVTSTMATFCLKLPFREDAVSGYSNYINESAVVYWRAWMMGMTLETRSPWRRGLGTAKMLRMLVEESTPKKDKGNIVECTTRTPEAGWLFARCWLVNIWANCGDCTYKSIWNSAHINLGLNVPNYSLQFMVGTLWLYCNCENSNNAFNVAKSLVNVFWCFRSDRKHGIFPACKRKKHKNHSKWIPH